MSKTYPVVRLNILNETIVFADQAVIEAETTQEIHPISIEVPASTARLRLWLDGARGPSDMEVSNAGSYYANGLFAYDGYRNGKPRYFRMFSMQLGQAYIVWVDDAWYISPYGNSSHSNAEIIANGFYRSYDDVETPDLCETWEIVSTALLPLPVVTAVIKRNLREKFSPFSDGEYYQAMAEGLVVDIRESIDGVEKVIGRFYTEDWSCPREGELEIVCTDLLGMMDNKNYLGNFFENPTRVDAIIADIMAYVGIGYTLDAAVGSKLLKGYVPGNITLREALQQVLFAAGAYASTAGVHQLNIKPSVIPVATSTGDVTITDDEKTDSQKLKLQKKITGVTVMSHDYFKSEGVIEEIFSEYLEPGDYLVVYPKPYWHVEVQGLGDSLIYLANTNGDVIVSPDSGAYPNCTIYTTFGEFEFGANHVYLHVPNPGGQTLVLGKPWHESNQLFEWTTEGSDSTRANVWKIDSATLVPSAKTSTEETAVEVLARVVSYANMRYQQEITLFPCMDVELGKVAVVDSLVDKDIVGIVERMSSDLTGGYLIGTKIVGLEHEEGN